MTEAWITRGNAVMPYVEVARERFHSELAAQLWGSGNCKALCEKYADLYTYWSLITYP